MKAALALGLAFLTITYTTAAYLNRKDNFAEDELLQDLENYIAERELGDGYANTDDDERISEILENLDERSLDLLVSTIDLSDLNGEPVEDSLMKREEKALAYSLLLADNPDLREVLGEDEDGRVDVEARKLKGLFKKLWNKIKALAKAAACKICDGNKPGFIKQWIWNIKWLRENIFKKTACKICG